jgi:hypothetical protein
MVALEEENVRRELLLALRDMARRQSGTSEILHLDLPEIAARIGATDLEVRNGLSDLLLEGLAEPFANTFTDHAEDGHCVITPAGMTELRRLL